MGACKCNYHTICDQKMEMEQTRYKGGETFSARADSPTAPSDHCKWGEWKWTATASSGAPLDKTSGVGNEAKVTLKADEWLDGEWKKKGQPKNCKKVPSNMTCPGCVAISEAELGPSPDKKCDDKVSPGGKEDVTVKFSFTRGYFKRSPTTSGLGQGNCDVPAGPVDAGSKEDSKKVQMEKRKCTKVVQLKTEYTC